MRLPSVALGTLSALLVGQTLVAATPAQDRLQAAASLRQKFNDSALSGLDLRFSVRGAGCDVLNVEGLNLYTEMMTALAQGTVVYGKVLPGGVNMYALRRGFKDIVYTNRLDDAYVSYGPSKLQRAAVLKLPPCTDALAASLTGAPSTAPPPAPAPYVPLSWTSATPGQKLYDASYKHDATIVSVDKTAGLITVQYVRNGVREKKRLESVASLWYVSK